LNFNVKFGRQTIPFEISDFEGPARFFWNRHPRPLKLVFGRFIQRTNRDFEKCGFKCARYRYKLKFSFKDHCVHFICQTDLCTSWAPGAFEMRFFFKILLVWCTKRLKTRSRGLGWQFRKKIDKGRQLNFKYFEKTVCSPTLS
jgi:hypothetical protein